MELCAQVVAFSFKLFKTENAEAAVDPPRNADTHAPDVELAGLVSHFLRNSSVQRSNFDGSILGCMSV